MKIYCLCVTKGETHLPQWVLWLHFLCKRILKSWMNSHLKDHLRATCSQHSTSSQVLKLSYQFLFNNKGKLLGFICLFGLLWFGVFFFNKTKLSIQEKWNTNFYVSVVKSFMLELKAQPQLCSHETGMSVRRNFINLRAFKVLSHAHGSWHIACSSLACHGGKFRVYWFLWGSSRELIWIKEDKVQISEKRRYNWEEIQTREKIGVN